MTGPNGEKLQEQYHAYQEAHFNVPAAGPGRYGVCFRNSEESRTDANIDLVYITLAHLRSKAKGKVQIPKGTEAARWVPIHGRGCPLAVQKPRRCKSMSVIGAGRKKVSAICSTLPHT